MAEPSANVATAELFDVVIQEVKIGTPGDNRGEDYTAPPGRSQEHTINFDIPRRAKAIAAWYTPSSNVDEFGKFNVIDIQLIDNNPGQAVVRLTLQGKTNQDALMDIRIYVLHVPR
jgi:hypothetical protein